MVLSALASELFLKCLLLIENKPPGRTHLLNKLYEELNDSTKARIESGWATMMGHRAGDIEAREREYGIEIPRDLPTALADCGDAFRLLRYIYEDPAAPKFYITDLPVVLQDVILDITGWTR